MLCLRFCFKAISNYHEQLLAAPFKLNHSHNILWFESENTLIEELAATDKTPVRLIRTIMIF
jgi:hypothetical protein